MLVFCSPIKVVAASIRYTTGSSFVFVFFLNGSSVTHNFVCSLVKGDMEKPPVSDP